MLVGIHWLLLCLCAQHACAGPFQLHANAQAQRHRRAVLTRGHDTNFRNPVESLRARKDKCIQHCELSSVCDRSGKGYS